MTNFDFSQNVDRRGTDAIKWTLFGEDVLPMWVADMEFGAPPEVMDAIRARLEHPVFGYQADSPQLRTTIAARMAERYGWQVDPTWIILMPGLVAGLNLVVQSVGEHGDGVIVMPPIYPPFLHSCHNFDRVLQHAPLSMEVNGHLLHYSVDFDALEAAVTPQSRLLLLCNPHNPTGRVLTEVELRRLIEFATRHNLIMCADEIHSDLIYSEHRHIPIASLDSEFATRTITLIAPSKTFNIPGLGNAAAIVPDADLRRKMQFSGFRFGMIPNVLGYAAADAAYRFGGPWLEKLLAQLEVNRDAVYQYVGEHFPQVRVTRPQATYLTWMDFRDTGIEQPQKWLLEHAKVALNDGYEFGPGGQGFVRLNFGCSYDMLMDGLSRIGKALAEKS